MKSWEDVISLSRVKYEIEALVQNPVDVIEGKVKYVRNTAKKR